MQPVNAAVLMARCCAASLFKQQQQVVVLQASCQLGEVQQRKLSCGASLLRAATRDLVHDQWM
jgi:hypothetical protein